MPRFKLMICQFPGGNSTHPDTSDWVTETLVKALKDPEIGEGNVRLWRLADTPVTMSRNRALVAAEQQGMDYVLFVDSDMSPDLPLPGAVPFWDAAWSFARAHAGPCVIAAPYCGPPPDEAVYVFRWENRETGNLNPDCQLVMYPRQEAARMSGIQPAAALPTGVMLIDMRALKHATHPRFYYEWKDEAQSQKASTEDVTFSRDLSVLGIPLYAAWSSWAGHWKSKLVMPPAELPADAIPAAMRRRAFQLATGDHPAPDALLTPPPPPAVVATAARTPTGDPAACPPAPPAPCPPPAASPSRSRKRTPSRTSN